MTVSILHSAKITAGGTLLCLAVSRMHLNEGKTVMGTC